MLRGGHDATPLILKGVPAIGENFDEKITEVFALNRDEGLYLCIYVYNDADDGSDIFVGIRMFFS